jgi:5-methylcytosine-specific restriction endonuclease McrA
MTSGEFWEEQFKDRTDANDFSGRLIRKNEYGVHSECGWTLDHILPLAMNGPDSWNNIQITHWKTNEEKTYKNPFEANGKLFQVKRVENLFDEDKLANYP